MCIRDRFGGDVPAYAEPRGNERGGQQQMMNDEAERPGGNPDIGSAQPLQLFLRRADASPERLLGGAVLVDCGESQQRPRQRQRNPGPPLAPAESQHGENRQKPERGWRMIQKRACRRDAGRQTAAVRRKADGEQHQRQREGARGGLVFCLLYTSRCV